MFLYLLGLFCLTLCYIFVNLMLYFLLFCCLAFFSLCLYLSSFSVCFYFGLIFVFLPFFDFLSLFSRCPPLSYIYCLTKTFQDPHSRWCNHSDTLTLLTSVLTGLTVRVKKKHIWHLFVTLWPWRIFQNRSNWLNRCEKPRTLRWTGAQRFF